MSTIHLAPLLAEAERRVLVNALRSHPSWTLGELVDYICGGGELSGQLRELRLEELVRADAVVVVGARPRVHGKGLVQERLTAAREATGEFFDGFVREVLDEAASDPELDGGWVDAAFLRARVGGPRWKLQASITRLIDTGEVERKGKTSSTRYRRSRS